MPAYIHAQGFVSLLILHPLQCSSKTQTQMFLTSWINRHSFNIPVVGDKKTPSTLSQFLSPENIIIEQSATGHPELKKNAVLNLLKYLCNDCELVTFKSNYLPNIKAFLTWFGSHSSPHRTCHPACENMPYAPGTLAPPEPLICTSHLRSFTHIGCPLTSCLSYTPLPASGCFQSTWHECVVEPFSLTI